MLETFGATFFGVIGSFLLWYGGQWWLKQRKDKIAVKHIAREIQEEISLNINILVLCANTIPNMISGGNIPVFIPYRLNLSVHRYLTSSGELRLVDVSQQRSILDAGMTSESFNRFIDNTELLLTLANGLTQPHSLVTARHRLTGLTEQAQDTAKHLNEILGELKGKVE
ncbi:hypothetical protein ACFLX3_02790 [Chloroflexota bacterium]